jgi:hypothetical protein
MVAFHVERGREVPLSAAAFYAGLRERFVERDGMFFVPEQAAEYDRRRLHAAEFAPLPLVVSDEASAVEWLRRRLGQSPQSFQELHPGFLRELGAWKKRERPLELAHLLEESFLRYDGRGPVPEPLWVWLSSESPWRESAAAQTPGTADAELRAAAKDRWYLPDPARAADLEKLRERALLREFRGYRSTRDRKLGVFRLEAVRAGFRKSWSERDYAAILEVARKLPEDALTEDPQLLMWYHQALTRVGAG